ncbi:hypothetical protein [Arenibaculum pallidiluteum]|uniref:hypothetical protein n=1 Tax=Arenibaculum pallidiluteum TaxID=2812559 RepID=UPI001A973B81|nr:hypothetical protein [Arenibaculum pallidiluteum]
MTHDPALVARLCAAAYRAAARRTEPGRKLTEAEIVEKAVPFYGNTVRAVLDALAAEQSTPVPSVEDLLS